MYRMYRNSPPRPYASRQVLASFSKPQLHSGHKSPLQASFCSPSEPLSLSSPGHQWRLPQPILGAWKVRPWVFLLAFCSSVCHRHWLPPPSFPILRDKQEPGLMAPRSRWFPSSVAGKPGLLPGSLPDGSIFRTARLDLVVEAGQPPEALRQAFESPRYRWLD